MEMDENNYEWVSVSTLAKRLGLSMQMVYNKINAGLYETKTFERGNMKGYLIKVPKEE